MRKQEELRFQMADTDAPLVLQKREILGKGLGQIRHEGLVPAVIHNHGAESVHVMAPEAELIRVYREAGKHHPLNLSVGDQKFLALIKDVHINPVKRNVQHVVFQAIRRDEKVEAEVPVRLEGEIPAEKVGLIVLRQLDTIEVEALPANLPEEFKVDATILVELHDKITVADLEVPEGVTILTDSEHPIATVAEPRAVAAEEAAEEEAAEGEAGEEGAEGEAGQPPEGEQAEAAAEQAKEN